MDSSRDTIKISGVDVEMLTMGEGAPLLFLHGGEGPNVPHDRHLKELARHFRVHAPWHPGFGRLARPDDFREVSDLAYLYLDLAEQLGLRGGALVGASFGGWVAAEMMIRDPSAFSSLVLAAPLGIKVRGREDRDIEDLFAMTEKEMRELAYADPARGYRDVGALDDEDLAGHFRSHESLSAYGWKPYMHNPQLRRWLHRLKVPTLLVAGEQDRLVFDGYHRAYNDSLPNSTIHVMSDAGHFPHVEQPEEFARLVHGQINRA
jgi:pimeloyl-ACP methyl ester carboxylesterase